MCRITVFVLSFLFYEQAVYSATVDQRQTGDLNVQIDLKNLHIVGLMTKGKEEYVDYDYAYDYSEMTIKPPNGTTTKKPLNVTETVTSDKGNTTTVTTLFTELDQTTSTADKNTESVPVTSTTKSELNEFNSVDLNATTVKPLPQDIGEITSTNSTGQSCKKGFFRNSQGNCELKLQNPSNALLKMIRQKAKLNLANGGRQP